MLPFFLDVLHQSTSVGILVDFRGILVSLGFGKDSLESLHSLSHLGVERGFDCVEMIMQVLSESDQESQWLIKV